MPRRDMQSDRHARRHDRRDADHRRHRARATASTRRRASRRGRRRTACARTSSTSCRPGSRTPSCSTSSPARARWGSRRSRAAPSAPSSSSRTQRRVPRDRAQPREAAPHAARRSSCRDVARFLAADTRTYDLVFCDPPYDEYATLEPPLARYVPRLLAEDGLLVLETAREDRAGAAARAAHVAPLRRRAHYALRRADGHRDLPRHVRPRHERAHRRDQPRGARSSTAS